MAGVTVSAGSGGGECHALDLGALAACVGVWLVRHVVVEVVVAAGFGSDRPHRGRRPFTMTAEVAGVEAAPEGEVNHRRDGRDDADKGSHGRGLFVPPLSSRAPLELKRDAAQGSSLPVSRGLTRSGRRPSFPQSPGIVSLLLSWRGGAMVAWLEEKLSTDTMVATVQLLPSDQPCRFPRSSLSAPVRPAA